jgi:very-short-patch-repair endonuclease
MKSGRERWRAAWSIQERARELRKDMTPAKNKLWSKMRNGQICGTHFRKQHPVGPFIIDFFCAKAKLAIEVDGDVHQAQTEYDLE